MDQDIALEIVEMEKSFGSKHVHKGVNLELRKNEVMGLFGSSGGGKSVVLRSVIGLDIPDSGNIFFEGKDIAGLKEHEYVPIRLKIGYVFQNGALFDSLTVEENLAYPLEAHTKMSHEEIKTKVNAMLELIDLKGANNLLPAELSGGMQKRAGLARAIILEPQIILFDEPTAGLDPVNTKRFLKNVHTLKDKGLTGIFVTHDIPSAFEVSDRIAILNQGRIHIVDTCENIKKSSDPIVRAFIEEYI